MTMTETFASIAWGDAAQTMIRATRDDGSLRIIEVADGPLWTEAITGVLGVVGDYVPPSPLSQVTLIDMAITAVDTAARSAAEAIVPPGMAKIYDYKIALAHAVVDDGATPDALIADEAADRSITPDQMAALILAMAADAEARLRTLEKARMAAKVALPGTTTQTEVDAITATFTAALQAAMA